MVKVILGKTKLMKIPFFNYKNYCNDADYESFLKEVLDSGYLIGGPFVDKVEEEMKKLTGIKYCICVGNATDAMEIIFSFLKLPLNSKVLVPSHTMLATASAAKHAGLIPVPMEVNETSLMTEIKELRDNDFNNVSACMITQLNGVVADMDPIKSFCIEREIALIEDSAQGIGAFNKGIHAGSWGIGGCISFYPAKVVGCLGDGGAILTNNKDLDSYARSVRDHGRGEELEAINWGRNSRLDSLNARVILYRLLNLNSLIKKRQKLAQVYDSKLKPLAEKGLIILPPKYSTNSRSLSTYQNYEIITERRNALMQYLKNREIGTIKQWGGFSIAHFNKLGFSIEDFPKTEKLFRKLLLLPMNHMMTLEEIEFVSDNILKFFD